MMNIFDELFRLQRIDNLIRTRATGTPEALAEKLGMSECTIYRLIGRLKEQGLPILYDKKCQTYYYAEPVKWNAEFIVGNEKILNVKGGEKKEVFFKLSIIDMTPKYFCVAFWINYILLISV
jgi:biotin operon repressor